MSLGPRTRSIWALNWTRAWGKNDGSVGDRRFFTCKEGCGLFVRTKCAVKARKVGLEMTTKKDDNIHNLVSYENTVQPSSKRKGSLQGKSGQNSMKKNGSQAPARDNNENEGLGGNNAHISTSTTKLRNRGGTDGQQ